jgi:hypothetical protein
MPLFRRDLPTPTSETVTVNSGVGELPRERDTSQRVVPSEAAYSWIERCPRDKYAITPTGSVPRS